MTSSDSLCWNLSLIDRANSPPKSPSLPSCERRALVACPFRGCPWQRVQVLVPRVLKDDTVTGGLLK